VVSTGPGYRSGGSPYRRATSATNGTADNRAGHGASPGLRKSVSQRHRRRKTKQEDQNKTLLHFQTCSLFNAFLCVGSIDRRLRQNSSGDEHTAQSPKSLPAKP
jgi:hypothetical protein